MIRNYDLDMAIEKENELRNKLKREKIKIANYCNDIKEKFKDVDRTINNYEATIKSMKEENEKVADEYDVKIDELQVKNNRIVKRIEDRIELFNAQKAKIVNGENKVNVLLQHIEEQKNNFKERAMGNKIKYDELERKFANLQKKIYEMQMNFEIKKAETFHNYKKVDGVAIAKNNYEREIRKIEKENESLTKELIDMQHHWKNITSSDINTTGKKTNRLRRITASNLSSMHSQKKSKIKF